MGDFGGDYGDYLKLLESNSALGFNPQADPIGDNQVSENLQFRRFFRKNELYSTHLMPRNLR